MSEEKPNEYVDYDVDMVRSEMMAHGVDGPLINRLEELIENECAERAVKLLDSSGIGYAVIRCSAVTDNQIREKVSGRSSS